MPEVGLTKEWLIQFGKETVLGTEVNATTKWNGTGFLKDDSPVEIVNAALGMLGANGGSYAPKTSYALELDEVAATFEQLPYPLNMGLEGVAGVRDSGTTPSVYAYTYDFPVGWQNPYTYTFECGDNMGDELMTGCFAEKIEISGAAGEAWKMTATLRGWRGGPTTRTPNVAIPSVLEFILFGNTSLYIDAVGDAFGDTQITDSFLDFKLTIENVYKAQWVGNGAAANGLNYAFPKLQEGTITLEFTLEHDDQAIAERAFRQANATRKFRIEATGSAASAPGSTYTTKLARIDLEGMYVDPDEFDDDDGNVVLKFKAQSFTNKTTGDRGEIIIVNELSALP